MSATFAQPTQDENLTPGWNVQGNISGDGKTGYAQDGDVVSGATTGTQADAGYPNPPGAGNIGTENSGSYSESVLTNPGYASTGVTLAEAVGSALPTGTATLVAGTVTVSNSSVLATSSIAVSSTNTDTLTVSAVAAGTFTVTSSSDTDTQTFTYYVIN